MSDLTIRLPDDQHEPLKALAAHRGVSRKRLIEAQTPRAVVGFYVEGRVRVCTARSNSPAGHAPALPADLEPALKAKRRACEDQRR